MCRVPPPRRTPFLARTRVCQTLAPARIRALWRAGGEGGVVGRRPVATMTAAAATSALPVVPLRSKSMTETHRPAVGAGAAQVARGHGRSLPLRLRRGAGRALGTPRQVSTTWQVVSGGRPCRALRWPRRRGCRPRAPPRLAGRQVVGRAQWHRRLAQRRRLGQQRGGVVPPI